MSIGCSRGSEFIGPMVVDIASPISSAARSEDTLVAAIEVAAGLKLHGCLFLQFIEYDGQLGQKTGGETTQSGDPHQDPSLAAEEDGLSHRDGDCGESREAEF